MSADLRRLEMESTQKVTAVLVAHSQGVGSCYCI